MCAIDWVDWFNRNLINAFSVVVFLKGSRSDGLSGNGRMKAKSVVAPCFFGTHGGNGDVWRVLNGEFNEHLSSSLYMCSKFVSCRTVFI